MHGCPIIVDQLHVHWLGNALTHWLNYLSGHTLVSVLYIDKG